MSKFSGRCDVYDSFVMIHNYTDEELKNNVKVYIGRDDRLLELNSAKDLIPYYPHLVSSACYNNTERAAYIHITEKSSVDYEEERSLKLNLEHLIRIYNRCKRKKIEFDVEAAVKELCYNGWNEGPITELANRVKEKGKKATIDGIHYGFHDYFRKELVKEMLENGINPADYGYGRFLEEK